MAQLSVLEAFDCDGDTTTLGSRWEKWKRALENYLTVAGIDDATKKRAVLLHSAGLALQEIFYNLPGANVEPSNETDVYQIALEKLTEYFSPKQSFLYERHLFRLMKQDPNEKFDKFVVRLRDQHKKCNFPKNDDSLIDQITEKCSSVDLRKKILMLGDTATMEKITIEANSLETVTRQLNEFGGKENPVYTNKIDSLIKQHAMECSRCGSKRHTADYIHCTARNKKCVKCGYEGHFQRQCRTRATKRHAVPAQKNVNPKRFKTAEAKTNQYQRKEKKEATTVDYIFHIDDDAEITCQVGGVNLKMLIDSGSKCNIVTDKTWNYLKSKSGLVRNQQKNPDKILMAYGSKEPLKILGAFEALVQVGHAQENARFYVIEGGTRDLLGKGTAISLNILKLGAIQG